jgi:hypothetical protein
MAKHQPPTGLPSGVADTKHFRINAFYSCISVAKYSQPTAVTKYKNPFPPQGW